MLTLNGTSTLLSYFGNVFFCKVALAGFFVNFKSYPLKLFLRMRNEPWILKRRSLNVTFDVVASERLYPYFAGG